MDLWQIQFRWDEHSPWLPFGLPHQLAEAKVRLLDIRVRNAKTEWRLFNLQTGEARDY